MTIEFPAGARIYVDANIWIYFLEGHPDFAPQVRAIFIAAASTETTLFTNEIAIAECLIKPAREKNDLQISAYDALFSDPSITILPVDGAIARHAALTGGELGLKLIDAMHHISAREAGCSYFFTGDGRFRSDEQLTVVGLE